ncbi:sialate O-acetylesterase [Allorhodopirellula solitaria]|uniref:Sialate O-acetylesterase domain-containing protein n=1 Tax=Allorhodopirellula solitaria TaxID=2527987 RepID=A0A5C5YIT4_9BACT|nr:sialate O-acetylesterase [Allorhodopirellula solitaria]TWT74782.1 hypothetical protein CA85_00670 [Allorhodopirellula solitaria]
MPQRRVITFALIGLLTTALSTPASVAAEPQPIQVFILAGQSNMEGHAKVSTIEYIADDPETKELYHQMIDSDGSPRVAEDAWISYFTGRGDENGEGHGKLTAGYGSRRNPAVDGGKIGPEFTFGLAMDAALEAPVLIIKTAWGGKSLFYDFRSPSSGVYVRSQRDLERDRNPVEGSGHYYRLMIQHVENVLGDIERVVTGYDPQQGYEISGFVWFQGFNDMVNRDVYPVPRRDSDVNRFDKYSEWLANLIRDVRKDLDAPELPFVIGVMGVDGMKVEKLNDGNRQFRAAMAAPASYSEFRANVTAIQTGEFWDEPLAAIQEKVQQVAQKRYQLNRNEVARGEMTEAEMQAEVAAFEAELISPEEAALRARGASNAGYHYLGCAKTFGLMGNAFAEAMLELMPATSLRE